MRGAERYVVAVIMTMLLASFALPAQSNLGGRLGVAESDRVSGIDRWAFRVNALELLCTVPNVNAEFDLSSSPYNRISLGLTLKYNWNTWHNTPPELVFNMFELRPEFRRWFRLKPKENSAPKERVFFLGAYVQGGTYSIKPGTYGIQGPLFGAGAIFGYDIPLYVYRRFVIDFELGVAVGLGVTSYDSFTMNRSGSDYAVVSERSRGMHLCPFPIVSELKACFVFRTMSIKDKYKKVDAQKMILKQEREDARRAAKEKRDEERRLRKEAHAAKKRGTAVKDEGGKGE